MTLLGVIIQSCQSLRGYCQRENSLSWVDNCGSLSWWYMATFGFINNIFFAFVFPCRRHGLHLFKRNSPISFSSLTLHLFLFALLFQFTLIYVPHLLHCTLFVFVLCIVFCLSSICVLCLAMPVSLDCPFFIAFPFSLTFICENSSK